jgi:hypothetical protein
VANTHGEQEENIDGKAHQVHDKECADQRHGDIDQRTDRDDPVAKEKDK